MKSYLQMSTSELAHESAKLHGEYEAMKDKGLKLDLSRGKPDKQQLELSMKMMDCLDSSVILSDEAGGDCRNYGKPEGIPEARRLMGEMLGCAPENTIVAGNSSLNLMHDCITIGFVHGYPGGSGGWCREETIKFLCPSPGYDRHFGVTQNFGFELVTVPMTGEGPDMDEVERLVRDPAVKGIWSVPKYSNPLGITYSDEVVRRMARLKPAAKDFRIFWDNAYAVHDLDPDHPDVLLNLLEEAEAAGNPDIVLTFTSTSKVTFPGGGISAVGASAANIAYILGRLGMQTIGFDKVNMLRHARYFPTLADVTAHMKEHAKFLRPKFAAVLATLEEELGAAGIAKWTRPNGGYFISLDVLEGCAKRTVALCKEAGVVMTGAGATYPYGKDPSDSNIRIAPTFATPDEVEAAAKLLCLCAKIACLEKLTAGGQISA